MRRSYKFRLYPNKEQTAALDRSLWLCRDLYNAAIQERRDAWKLNRITIGYFDQSKQITDIRINDPLYMTVQARVLRQTLRQADKAFQAFFRRVKTGEKPGYPRFKSRDRFNSFFYNGKGFKFAKNKLFLANIGFVQIKQHREIAGNIKEIGIKREGSKWFAVISCAEVPNQPLPETCERIGLDVGIESFATLSNGTQIDNWKYYESSSKKLRTVQRRVARRKKGSQGRRRAVAQLRKVHQKIFNRREDFQHKLSTDLIRNYDLIAVEKLNIKGMSAGFLSKQIHDAAWSSFLYKLAYKAESAGRQLIEVDPRGTSQTCTCGATVKKSLSVRQHICDECGLAKHRDIVSAKVILQRAGLALKDITCGVSQSVSLAVAY